MSINTSVNPNNRNYTKVVEDALGSNANRMGEAIAGAAKVAGKLEDEMLKVFSQKPGAKLDAELKKIAESYGFKVDSKTGELIGSVEGLQLAVRSKYEGALRTISNLSTFMANMNQLIRQIGRDFRLN